MWCILNHGHDISYINQTNLVMIHKKRKLSIPLDFCPISLCNVIYKLVSKMMVIRLKPYMPIHVSKSHCAFVLGRLIFDNVVIAREIAHSMKNKRSGRISIVGDKLDVSKAYDCVEWQIINGLLVTMGFSEKWVHLIMNYVSTVSFSFLLNA